MSHKDTWLSRDPKAHRGLNSQILAILRKAISSSNSISVSMLQRSGNRRSSPEPLANKDTKLLLSSICRVITIKRKNLLFSQPGNPEPAPPPQKIVHRSFSENTFRV